MKKNIMKKNIIKSTAFIAIFLMIVSCLTVLVIQKPTTDNTGFYEQEKNSIDVLYIGSSHTYCSISPLDLYEEYGYTGFIRATSCQRAWESYALLEDSLKYQTPKVVVYEVMAAYHEKPQLEAFAREIYDTMRPGKAKYDGLMAEFAEGDADKLSFLFPMFRYHERWKELAKNDFTYLGETDHLPNKGYALVLESIPVQADYDWNRYQIDAEAKEVPALSEEYIRKMKALCDEKGIEFVMLKAPTGYVPYWDVSMSKGISNLAAELNVPFIDYNMGEDAILIDWNNETCDEGNHLNYYGAMKVTEKYGKWLKENIDLPDHRGDSQYASWDAHYNKYQQTIALSEMKACDDYLTYMDLIKNHLANDNQYLVMITGKKNFLNAMTDEHKEKLLALGNDLNYVSDGEKGIDPNIFILQGGNILIKKQTPDNITDTIFVGNHKIVIDCQNEDSGDCCDVSVDGSPVSLNAMGLDVIIYDIKNQMVVDTVFAKFDDAGVLRIYR